MKRVPLLLALLPLALAIPSVASAGEREAAEHRQLSDDMERLAGKGAWEGVDRKFKELLELESKGEVITYEEWFLGAQAAQNIGDLALCRERLEGAVAADPRDEAVSWLEQIDATYGPVNVRSADKEAETSLTPAAMPFAPDQRRIVEIAQAEIAEKRAYDGLLPAGSYTLTAGGSSTEFTVTAGGELVEVRLTPRSEGGAGALSYVGPRVDVGGAFTLSTAPRGESAQPPSFRGAGARAGAGIEIGFRRGFGIAAQVGYHNLLSPSGRDDLSGVPNKADSLHLGYGMVGPTVRIKDDLWLGAGGVLAFGVANASGIADLDQVNADCPYRTEQEDCGWVSGVPEEQRPYFPWSTELTTPGFQAGLSYALFDVGPLRGGVGVTGGVLFDPSRMYPWGQVALTIGPAPSRS